jgi:hypothetical protein
MEEVQKPINVRCNIALSARCKTDNLNFVMIGRGVANSTGTVSRGRDEITELQN